MLRVNFVLVNYFVGGKITSDLVDSERNEHKLFFSAHKVESFTWFHIFCHVIQLSISKAKHNSQREVK